MAGRKNLKVGWVGHRGLLTGLLFIIMMVLAAPAQSFPENIRPPLISDVTPHPLREKVFLVMKAERTSVYLHEIVPVTIRLFFQGVNLKDIQYPRLSHESFSVQEFEHPVEKRETINEIIYETVEFKTNLFAKKTGDFRLGPARLRCTVWIGKGERDRPPPSNHDSVDSYFGASENVSLDLESEQILFKVSPFPQEGKPADFEGAVGNFSFTAEVHPREVRLGETIVLRMRIQGKGNFHTVTSPRIEKGMDFKIYDPQTSEQTGLKIYEQVLIPRSEAVKEVPQIRFIFYDPERAEYRTLHEGPFPIKVIRPDGEKEQKIGSVPGAIGRDLITIKESPGRLKKKGDFLYKNKTFLLFQLLPLLLFVSLLLFNRRRERLRTDVKYAMRLEARKEAKRGVKELERILEKENPIDFYNSLFKTLQGYLGNRLCLSSGGITGAVVEEVLKPKGADGEVLKKLREIFNECDQVRYAASTFGKKEMEETFNRTKEVIRYLENQPL
jgi:hypothetical protein